MQSVTFINREAAEQKLGAQNLALISITQPNTPPAALKTGWHSVLKIQFDDTNPEIITLKKRKTPRVAITLTDAIKIVKYVHETASAVEEIIVHCQGGISRSAAVAKWIAETYDLAFDHKYDLYNKYVYRLLLEADKRTKYKS